MKYVEPLIGRETINTVPIETLDAYREHGRPTLSLEDDTGEAHRVLETLPKVGIDLDAITQQLEDEGVAKFSKAFDQLIAALRVEKVRQPLVGINHLTTW